MANEIGLWIDWDDDGWANPYSNLTGRVRNLSYSRGGSYEITGSANPGRATFELSNLDGFLTPDNADGPLYGKLFDGHRVWLGCSEAGNLTADMFDTGTVRGRFAGLVMDITPLPSRGVSVAPFVEITCEDMLAVYGRVNLDVGVDAIQTGTTRSQKALRTEILDVADALLTFTAGRDLDDEIQTMPVSWAKGSVLSALQDLNNANGTRHFIRPADQRDDWCTYVTRNRQYKLGSSGDLVLGHIREISGWRTSSDTIINHQEVSWIPVQAMRAIDTVWRSDILPISIPASGDVIETVDLAEPIEVVDPLVFTMEPGWSGTSTWRNVGRSFTYDLTNTDADPIRVLVLAIQGRRIIENASVTVSADDPTSQALPRGIRQGASISGEYVGVGAAATGMAEHMVWRYGSPLHRPQVTLRQRTEIFALDLYDTVSLTLAPVGADTVVLEIVGLSETIDKGRLVDTTLTLQESRIQNGVRFFLIGTDQCADATHALAY